MGMQKRWKRGSSTQKNIEKIAKKPARPKPKAPYGATKKERVKTLRRYHH